LLAAAPFSFSHWHFQDGFTRMAPVSRPNRKDVHRFADQGIFPIGAECGVDQEVHATAGREAGATRAHLLPIRDLVGGVFLARGFYGRKYPNAYHDDGADDNPARWQVHQVRGIGQSADHDCESGSIESERHAISFLRRWQVLEQNHDFHARNGLIKGVDFLRKSTL
jgi:hypothetical protein